MPSLKALKNRIASVKNTRKITKAMQMVAAAKLRRAQEAAEAARPYADRMNAVMAGLSAAAAGNEGAPRLLAGTGSDKVHLLVVMTSERGLCGGFNSTIVRLARARANDLLAHGKTVKILTVGKKGREQLRRDFGTLFVGHVDLTEVRRVGYSNAQSIASDILARFNAGEFDVATLFFNRFQSVISQIPTAQQIIPAQFDSAAAESTSTLYDYEPSEEAILADLLPRNVATQVFTALLENGASEQGARMSAMDNATRNAGDMINKLTIQYNRSRQAAITTELIEIIAGAEAL
ncbi:F0F1 ATP synthase subunit gamma [Tabrizicola sp. J26]|uniref:F0F1 ATP synthase subunit gamma n=1 Tax=Alitabrizicola rongguiensis TaxID=2909234 RepID=UPI001F2AFD5E|nr:F0F1 ATP synthase subunit gamma [Tabrizicola rongguiensis]MCF1710502.1 F0F1 ATP synthase subunit gamma [Tabrizicola rongguiensis]